MIARIAELALDIGLLVWMLVAGFVVAFSVVLGSVATTIRDEG